MSAAISPQQAVCAKAQARRAFTSRRVSVKAPLARQSVKVQAHFAVKEERKNVPLDTPVHLLRAEDTPETMRYRMEKMIRETQDKVVAAIAEVDGTPFRQDCWLREEGGGGITRVLANGNVWEKAGVNVSVVYGTMPAEAYRAAVGHDVEGLKGGRVPFFATGVSSVMHPHNPHCPTMHFNYRYFETADWNGIPGQWWFGGGTDITPSYVVKEDMEHFHGTYKKVCDRHDPTYYPKFKKWCDEYFTIAHRGEMRGLGGIFFDDLNDRDPDLIFNFAKDCADHIVESYVPIIKKHMNDPYTEEQKQWQKVRRGRYVEFNLVYDRGTIFGMKTGGRTESILMSMPLNASWLYDHEPEAGTPEAEFMDACRNPRNWV